MPTVDRALHEVVNVASVSQRSPFRYPGGKTWLVPRVRRWLKSLPGKPSEFVEPFAGGGIASLTVAFEGLAHHVTMVELDDQVAAVWRTILDGDAEWLAQRIAAVEVTRETVEAELSRVPQSLREKAFQTLLKNRVNYGGILAPGASLVKWGENGKGIKSRWYPTTLQKRIRNIVRIRDRVTFIEGDGMAALREHKDCAEDVFFIDPPYTAAGKKAGTRLYTHYGLDHDELFRLVAALSGDFLMTYDDSNEIRDLARQHGFDIELVAMTGTHLARMTELLIGRNLDWARSQQPASLRLFS